MDSKFQNGWEDEEVEIDLKELLIAAIQQAKTLLICGLVFAVLLLGWRLFSVRASNAEARESEKESLEESSEAKEKASSAAEEAYEAQLKAYDAQLASYEVDRDAYEASMENYNNNKSQLKEKKAVYASQKAVYDAQIKEVEESIAEQETKKEESVLLNMDPYHFVETHSIWYVDTHYTVNPNTSIQNPDKTGAVLNAYVVLMRSSSFYAYLQGEMSEPLDARNLADLVRISTDTGNRTFTLVVIGNTRKQVNELFNASERYFLDHKEETELLVTEHDITLLEHSVYDTSAASGDTSYNTSYSNSIISSQSGYRDTMNSLKNKLMELKDKRAQLAKPVLGAPPLEPTEPETPKEPETEEEPEIEPLDLPSAKKEALKFGVIGLVLGGFLACGWVFIQFISKDAAVDEEAIRRRFGVPVLASLKRFPGKDVLSRFSAFLSGDAERASDMDGLVSLSYANINSVLDLAGAGEGDGGSPKQVLLVGSRRENLEKVAEGLSAQGSETAFAVAGDVLTEPNAVEKLQRYEGVVLVEQKGATSYKRIGREVNKLSGLRKRILGMIAL